MIAAERIAWFFIIASPIALIVFIAWFEIVIKRKEMKNKKVKTMTKAIIVKWVPEEDYGYGMAMRVIESNHERFVNGSRFDYGFFSIATIEGFTIISLPFDKVNNNEI